MIIDRGSEEIRLTSAAKEPATALNREIDAVPLVEQEEEEEDGGGGA